MSRPRVPTAQLQAKGSFLRHPERKRAREHEPKPKGPLGEPPADFDKEHKAVWHEHAAIIPPGVATSWDQTAFEVLVCLIVNFRRRRRNAISQVVGEIGQMNKLFTQFGMTPSDRSRVTATPQEEKKFDPLAEFIGKPQ